MMYIHSNNETDTKINISKIAFCAPSPAAPGRGRGNCPLCRR